MGTLHRATGLLMMARRGYELHVDGGGVWALDLTRSPKALLGRRVTVEGIRGGFDLLDVRKIESAIDR
ncbi:DUF5818 domain-containing protein [Sphingomonas sp. SUN039]|uniref:DUF5818 domain-containing protein n=1 Tax=Sphingomonas sp. SUN039 TaxID=2937787 RepID=UPI002164036F|nr:DUF5818 domain-containing protein [Sphingomonas sp. SUN039]UVO53738.1 DUF5818 domain-containing protein [Sphingomonas sp. SUN039]